MNSKQRHSRLLLQHRQGILNAYLQDDELSETAMDSLRWSDEPRKGVEALWSDESPSIVERKKGPKGFRAIRILDSFFTDTLTEPRIRDEIFTRAVSGVPVRILLADPAGIFAKTRAEELAIPLMKRSIEGLAMLATECNRVRRRVDSSWSSLEREIAVAKFSWEKTAETLLMTIKDLEVEVRLYQVSPSGPLYFFSDLLLAGRFWAHESAANMPWEHIIDTPISNDLYDIMLGEFFAVWDGARKLEECLHAGPAAANPLVFFSCCRGDQNLVEELEATLQAAGIATYVFWNDIPTGHAWPEIVHQKLNACGVLVAVLTENALKNSDWVRAEIGGAWALGKRIMQAKVGNQPSILPGILHHQWAEDVISSAGKAKLIADIKAHFGR